MLNTELWAPQYIPDDQERAQLELARCLDVLRRARRELNFGASTALLIHGLMLPRGHTLGDDHVHVCVADQRSRSRIGGVCFHTWPYPTMVSVIPVGEAYVQIVDPVTACLQMLRYCSRQEAVVMFDMLMCRNPQQRVTSHEELREFVAQRRGFAGRETALWALNHCREGVDSPMETRLRLKLTGSGLPCPEVNIRVIHPVTREMWFLDLAYPHLFIAFEYQGELYHASRSGLRRDSRKISALQGLGWRIITITADMLNSQQGWQMLLETVTDVMRQQSRLYHVKLHVHPH